MSVVDALRQNDPATTRINIWLRDEPSDADLAQALLQNAFITEIVLNVHDTQGSTWNSLLQVIATRANLEAMRLWDATTPEERNAPAALISAILRATQQNSAIRTVVLFCLRLPADISMFVDNASSITSIGFHDCVMEPNERERGARDLAAALQRNTNIQTLELNRLDDIYAIPILQGLRANTSVNSLSIGGESCSDATAGAIQQLLQSTVSIETFGLRGPRFINGDMFPSVAQHLIRSPIVCVLKFSHCQFRDEECAALFRGILQNKQNLTGLCLERCVFSGVHADIISALLRPDSPLQSFELKEFSLGIALPNSQFQNLLRAVEKSKLERFAIGNIESHEQLRTLTDSIPRMRVKKLQVVIAGGEQNVNKQLLLQAVKNNFSLRSVDGKESRPFGRERDIFDNNDKPRLVFYANRNENLDQWVDNPETVKQQKVWPDVLSLAERAGPDSLFRGLRSVLGSDYVSLRAAGREAHASQHYVPS